MEITYTMIGADGSQYGPISLEQFKGWIAEGRVEGDTKVLRSDTKSWLPAANYTELGFATPAPAMPATPPPISAGRPMAASPAMIVDPFMSRPIRAGASWFFFIAAFSVINSLLAMSSERGTFFLIGLGVNLMTRNLGLNLVVAGIFAAFGYFARKGQTWAFAVGMVFYALDALIFIPAQMWLPLAFHAYALFRMFQGLKACLDIRAQNR